jgi:hypothetical protein
MMTSDADIKTALENSLVEAQPEWWAKTFSRSPDEIAAWVAKIVADKASRVVPAGDLHKFASDAGEIE